MTKIVFEGSINGGSLASKQVKAIDLARRFEWRLSWEKSHLDRQSITNVASQFDHPETSASRLQAKLVRSNEVNFSGVVHNISLPAQKQSDSNGIGQQPSIGLTHAKNKISQRHAVQTRMLNVFTGVPLNELSNNASIPLSANKLKSSTNIARMLIHQYPIQKFKPMHIYITDRGVQISMRDFGAGLSKQEGMMLIFQLRRTLTSLGMSLARLVVNGELIWAKRSPHIKGHSADDHSAIDGMRRID